MTLLAVLRQSAKSLGRQPGFALALIVTAAVGIGGNASVLGFTKGLFNSHTSTLDNGSVPVAVFARDRGGTLTLLSNAQYLALKEQVPIFELLAAVRETRNSVGLGASSVVASVAMVTQGAWDLFGLPPGAGIVLSQQFLEQALGSLRNITQQHATIDGVAFPIAGVAPARLNGIYAGRPVDVWVRATALSTASSDDSRSVTAIGRLRRGSSIGDAQEALDALGAGALVAQPYTGLLPEKWQAMHRIVRLMSAAAGAVFLIACANVTTFLLSRAANRSRETALRMALGATRGTLTKAAIVDSALIATAGGVGGLLVARWTADVIPALLFESDAAHLTFVQDPVYVVAAVSVSVVITLSCGMVPLFEIRRDNPGAMLQHEPRQTSKPLRAIRRALVTFQMSACCALIVSSVALDDAIDVILRTSSGNRLGRPILATVESRHGFAQPDLGLDYFRGVERLARAMDGITSVAWTATLPGAPTTWYTTTVEPPGLAVRDVSLTAGLFTPHSLRRIVLPPTRGRMFGGADTSGTCRVVVVQDTAVAALFQQDPVGRVLEDPTGKRAEIIGVVTPRPPSSKAESPEPSVYYYASQGDLPFSSRAPVTFRVPVLPANVRSVMDVHVVSANYFTVLNLPLRSGELFTDDRPAAFCRVAVINAEAERLYFSGNAIGGAVIDGAGLRTTVVGVVEDMQSKLSERRIEPSIYLPMTQNFLPRMHLILGSQDARPERQAALLRDIEALEGGKPKAAAVISLDDRLRLTALAAERIGTLLLGAAAFNALAIGILGLQRIIVDDVVTRRREIAVRSALGAPRWRLIAMVVVQAARIATTSALLGILGAFVLARWIRGIVGVEASPTVWASLTGPMALVLMAVFASALPAYRILGIAPLTAMRRE